MIPESKLIDIATKLLEKSKRGEVHWNPRTGSPTSDDFVVWFPTSCIHLKMIRPESEPEYLRFEILNDAGQTVGGLTIQAGEPNWSLFQDLFSAADRYVTKWDQVLDEIESEMTREGTVGQTPQVGKPRS
jgi:hypothetical protein